MVPLNEELSVLLALSPPRTTGEASYWRPGLVEAAEALGDQRLGADDRAELEPALEREICRLQGGVVGDRGVLAIAVEEEGVLAALDGAPVDVEVLAGGPHFAVVRPGDEDV